MTGKTIFSGDYQRLVKKIAQARTAAGLTQRDLAQRLKKTQSYVSKIESAQIRVDVVQLKEIARILSKRVEHFLS